MLRKLLLSLIVLTSFQLTYAQAPGNTCDGSVGTGATVLALVSGSTITTGQQTTNVAGFSDEYGLAEISGCAPFGVYGDTFDGVYAIDVTVTGDYIIGFTNYGSDWKSLTLHDSCLGVCIDGFGTNAQLDGDMTVTLTAGTRYYLVIDSTTFFRTGGVDFELFITSPIANSNCSGATEVFSSVSCNYVTYTNEGATDSGVASPGCANYQGGDVWFTYTVNSTGAFKIDLEDSGVMDDSGLAVYTGSCGSLALIECDDNDSSNGNMSSVDISGRTEGEVIYIRVWEDGNDNNGTFGLCITTDIPTGDVEVDLNCGGDVAREFTTDTFCPPSVLVAGSTTLSGDLLGQPTADRLPAFHISTDPCEFQAAQPRRYEVINFTVPVTGLYTFTCAATWDAQGYIVENNQLFTPGSCGSGNFIAGDDDSGAGTLPLLNTPTNLVAGTVYSLITTEFGIGTVSRTYSWTISGASTTVDIVDPVGIDWYTTSSGGSPIASGPGFNPTLVAGSGLTDTNTPGVYSFWYACDDNPSVRTELTYVIGKVWLGGSSDWTDPTNWSEGTLPDNTKCVYIPSTANDPIIDDNDIGEGYALIIEDAASLNIVTDTNNDNMAGALVVQDYIDVQGTGSLVVQEHANLIQVLDASTTPRPTRGNGGSITLNRTTDIRQTDYVYWSSPVASFNLGNIYGGFTPTNRMYEWIPTTVTGSTSVAPGPIGTNIEVGNWSATNGSMSEGKGYIVQGPTNFTSAIATANVQFSGVPNNGVITQSLSSGGYTGPDLFWQPAGVDLILVTENDDNWNLIGNPYPSSISADAFLNANTLIEGAVHIWTHGTEFGSNGDSFYNDYLITYDPNDYITYNLTGVTNPNPIFSGNIASGQGFFVLALNDNETGNVTFDNSMRLDGALAPIDNTDFYRTSDSSADVNATERHRIWIDLISNNTNASSSMLVGYVEGATQEKDRLYDAIARQSGNLSLYSMINDKGMVIQGRALPFQNTDQVPLGAVLPTAGQYTIAITGVDGLFLNDTQNIFLEDTYTGIYHNLKAAPYIFNTDEDNANFEDRFVLRYTDEQLSVEEFDLNTISVFTPNSKYIKIKSELSAIQSVIVYDLLGRTLVNTNNLGTLEFSTENNAFESGTYIVQVGLENGSTKTQKVILKQ